MIAVIEGYRAGLYARHQWLPNIIAGLVVGIVALPLSMAFAIASGARPEQGIYTAIIGGGLVTLLGGSRLQIAGPTGAFIVILAGITAKYGMAGLQVATLMAGVMLLLMGLIILKYVLPNGSQIYYELATDGFNEFNPDHTETYVPSLDAVRNDFSSAMLRQLPSYNRRAELLPMYEEALPEMPGEKGKVGAGGGDAAARGVLDKGELARGARP